MTKEFCRAAISQLHQPSGKTQHRHEPINKEAIGEESSGSPQHHTLRELSTHVHQHQKRRKTHITDSRASKTHDPTPPRTVGRSIQMTFNTPSPQQTQKTSSGTQYSTRKQSNTTFSDITETPSEPRQHLHVEKGPYITGLPSILYPESRRNFWQAQYHHIGMDKMAYSENS